MSAKTEIEKTSQPGTTAQSFVAAPDTDTTATAAVLSAGGAGSTNGGPPGSIVGGLEPAGELPPVDERPRRKIALVGYTTSREETPYDDPSWEKWGMNNLHLMADVDPAKFTRWYNLHDLSEIVAPPEKGGDPAHLAWLRTWKGCPIFLMDPAEGLTVDSDGTAIPPLSQRFNIPAAMPFPSHAILQHFPDYFTNTVSWQIAHAIFEAMTDDSYVLTDLGLWGIDMAVGTEYAAQRPSVEFFLGIAQGLGVECHLPGSSDLLKTVGRYGGVDANAGIRSKVAQRLKELRMQKEALEAQVQQLQFQHASVCGAIDSFSYMAGVWLPGVPGGDNRDKVLVPAGAVSPVAQQLAEAEAKDRHAPKG